MSTTFAPAPRPIGPQREGIAIQDAPGLLNGWQRKCLHCWCSVGSDHVAGGEECRDLQDERYWKAYDDGRE